MSHALVDVDHKAITMLLQDMDVLRPTGPSHEFLYLRLTSNSHIAMYDHGRPKGDQACKEAPDRFLADKRDPCLRSATSGARRAPGGSASLFARARRRLLTG